MARTSARTVERDLRTAISLWQSFSRLPLRTRLAVIGLAVVAGLIYLWANHKPAPTIIAPADEANQPPAATVPGDGSYLFCFWNVENLFDDKVDPGRRSVDKEFDVPFGEDAALRQEKLDRLTAALLRMNEGRGPDILACAEVESVRAADLLRATLNAKLTATKADPRLQYTQVSMKNIGNDAGRHISTCVITRLPVAHQLTRVHGRNLRILETHLVVNGSDLTVISSHWTSQLTQRDGGNGGGGRDRYAETIYDVYKKAFDRNPGVDFLVCGDFNCEPEADSVRNVLGALVDRTRLTSPPALLNLFAGKDPAKYGTHWYSGKPLIYDHICVSPGLLDDKGWKCDPDTARSISEGLTQPGGTRRQPWRFGGLGKGPIGGRGYSDHFPVVVRLSVRPAAGPAKEPE
ncbi:MAG: endonuclease/exonuclease/phosphatase family protein [Gemmataceae bacterium]